LNPSPLVIGSPEDAGLFYHATQITVEELDAGSDARTFWQTIVLPLAHTVEPIKQALCAMGGAHRRFLIDYDATDNQEITSQSNLAAIQKYNQAITHIMPLMTSQTPDTLRTTIICCIIFICIENLHGRYADSVRHLHAACHLLNSLHLEEQRGGDRPSAEECNLLNVVTGMVHKLGRKVAMYLGDDMFFIPDFPSQIVEPGNPLVPFSSFGEADQLLRSIDGLYSDFGLAADGTAEWSHSGHFHNRRWDEPMSPVANPSARAIVLDTTRSSLEIWGHRFELLQQLQNTSTRPLTREQQRQNAVLSLNQSFWSSILKLQATGQQLQEAECEAMLQRAQTLVDVGSSSEGRTHPIFAFDGDLIPSLYIVCCFCKNVDVLRRAVSMLRLLRRREGIWDSDEVAGICETILSARQEGLSYSDDVATGEVQMLSQSGIPGIANPPFSTLC
jgi:hypothetical protein